MNARMESDQTRRLLPVLDFDSAQKLAGDLDPWKQALTPEDQKEAYTILRYLGNQLVVSEAGLAQNVTRNGEYRFPVDGSIHGEVRLATGFPIPYYASEAESEGVQVRGLTMRIGQTLRVNESAVMISFVSPFGPATNFLAAFKRDSKYLIVASDKDNEIGHSPEELTELYGKHLRPLDAEGFARLKATIGKSLYEYAKPELSELTLSPKLAEFEPNEAKTAHPSL